MRYLILLLFFTSCAHKNSILNEVPKALPFKKKHTNVIFILASDLGIGDIQAYNPKSSIPTKNLDYLAKNGLKFTNAHSNSSISTPTRYGVLTGRYAWRTSLKRGILHGFSPALIKNKTITVADIFKKNGYKTACIGKWQLGMDIPLLPQKKGENKRSIDTNRLIINGPNSNGFDYFYGISASLDFPPYAYIENNRFTEKLDQLQKAQPFPIHMRTGIKSKNFSPIDTLDDITTKANIYISKRVAKNEKFFLYLPLTAPHKPITPHPRFHQKTTLGPYGDYIYQLDFTIGKITNELKKHNILDNTLVIITSDNGSFMYNLDNLNNLNKKTRDRIKNHKGDHQTSPQVEGYYSKNHRPNLIYRGTKADIWEAGHRVPFIVHWPKGIKDKGRSTDTAICLTDFFATACDLLGYKKTATQGQDSYSFLKSLKKLPIKPRIGIIHHSSAGMFAIRKGDWKLVLGNGSGGRQLPIGKAFEKPYQLFNMKSDPVETYNFINKQQIIAKQLEEEFKAIFNSTRAIK